MADFVIDLREEFGKFSLMDFLFFFFLYNAIYVNKLQEAE